MNNTFLNVKDNGGDLATIVSRELGALNAEKLSTIAACEEETTDLNMKLTEHFTLKEFVISATAIRNGLDNTPPAEEVQRLRKLCENVLEPLRMHFGAIRITSGYRSYRVNELIGGARTSQHLYGEAADIHCGSTETGRKYYNFILENLDFDQLLLEFSSGKHPHIHCLHVSFRSDRGKNRKRCSSYYPV